MVPLPCLGLRIYLRVSMLSKCHTLCCLHACYIFGFCMHFRVSMLLKVSRFMLHACYASPHPSSSLQGLRRLILYGVDAYLSCPSALLRLTSLTGLQQLCVDVMEAAEPLVLAASIMQVGGCW